MATGISWTDETWNPTTGCDKVSPGCGLPRFEGDGTGGCYAMAMAKRLKAMGQAKYQNDGDPHTSGPGFGLTVHPDALTVPLRWRKPRRIFVNSMSDLFHEAVSDEYIDAVFGIMAQTPQHTYQVLTKRHGRMRSLLNSDMFRRRFCFGWPLPNVHLGVSAEDQKWADIRIPALIGTPAAVRFVSAEPLLGPIDVSLGHSGYWQSLSWVIAGGESGPGARPCEIDWLYSLRDQCADADVPFFCKQFGAVLGRQFGAGSHGDNWDAWPADLRIRQFPRTTARAAA